MKTVGTLLATAFVLMPWCIYPLLSQQNNTDKSIVITKRSVDADGSEVVETIIKKGKATENFNVEEYIRNNRSDKVQLDVRVEGIGQHKSWDWEAWSQNLNNTLNNKTWNWDNYDVNVREKEACLGVYTGAATRDEKSGAQISSFTDKSAAREVQMAEGDLILSVNGQRVQGHEDLWNEIAKYKPNDKVKIEYLREGKTWQVEAALKSCPDNSSRVEIRETDEGGDKISREFLTWNWGNDEQKRMQERRVITIHRGEGDAPEITNQAPPSSETAASPDRKLKLESFRAFPNPTAAQVTIAFKGEPVATTVALFDASGRQLFREEMNAFRGDYFQQFDLTEYAKGAIVVLVQQGDKVYSEQIIVH